MLGFITSFVLVSHKLDDAESTATDTGRSQAPVDPERYSYEKRRSSSRDASNAHTRGRPSGSFSSYPLPGGLLSVPNILSGSSLFTPMNGIAISRRYPLQLCG